MITIQRRDDLAVDDQRTASVRWHLGQHPFIDPEGSRIGPIVAIKEVTIEPKGAFRASVPHGTEELLYIVSGDVSPVGYPRDGRAVPPGTVMVTIDGRRRGHHKFYNPLTGEGQGARDFGWSTLVLDLMAAERGGA